MAENIVEPPKICCLGCGKTLLQAEMINGIFIKICPNCGTKNTFKAEQTKKPAGRS